MSRMSGQTDGESYDNIGFSELGKTSDVSAYLQILISQIYDMF